MKSQKKVNLKLLFIIFLIPIIIAFFYIKNNKVTINDDDPIIIINSKPTNAPMVLIGENKIYVDLAKTTSEVSKGLSGRPTLAEDHGMLFIFSKASRYRFWMPDMNFPLDIIWINEGRIVDISKNASNVFDIKNPVYYRPSSPAQYVLEVNANFCDKNNIKIGDVITFENIEYK